MAQTKRRRKRKRRGTQSGSIDRTRRARPRSREEAKAQARRRSQAKKGGGGRTPTWSGAFWRGLLGAAIFFLMTRFIFGETTGSALGLSAVMLVLYIPLSYYIDRFFYRRRLKQEREERARR